MAGEEYTHPKLLLVEGEDDRRFFSAMIRRMDLDDVQIQPYSGVNNLSRFLDGLILSASFRENVISLGVTRDANASGEASAKQSLMGTLFRVGLSESQNRIEPTRVPNITTFILCGSDGTGSLEDLIWESIEPDWRTNCLDTMWECLDANRPTGDQPPRQFKKAQLAVYLATHRHMGSAFLDEDDLRLDYAVDKKQINHNHPAFSNVKDFLRGL